MKQHNLLLSLSLFLGITSLRVARSNYRISTNIDYRVGLSDLPVSVAIVFPVIERGNTGIAYPRDDLWLFSFPPSSMAVLLSIRRW